MTRFRFHLKQEVCRWIKLKRWTQPFPGSRDEPFWKIRILYISSIKIRYCSSSQVHPERSGWLNTIAAFFFVFHVSYFFSQHFCFSLHLSLHIMHNRTNTHTQFVTLLPDLTSLPSFTTLTCTRTHTTCFQAVIVPLCSLWTLRVSPTRHFWV